MQILCVQSNEFSAFYIPVNVIITKINFSVIPFLLSEWPELLKTCYSTFPHFVSSLLSHFPSYFPCYHLYVYPSFWPLPHLLYISLFLFFLSSFREYIWIIWKFPGLGLNRSHIHPPMLQPQQHRIWDASATNAAACSSAGSLTHWGHESHLHLHGYKPTEPQWEVLPCLS